MTDTSGLFHESPKWAHVGRPPPHEIWWDVHYKALENSPSILQVLSRTWFAARAVAMVHLRLGPDDVVLTPSEAL